MSKVKIAYENILDGLSSYVFTTGTENGDNPFANAYDNFLFDYMRLAASASAYQIDSTLSASASADCFALYRTDLATAGGTIQLKYWDGAAYVNAFENLAKRSEKLNTSPWTVTRLTVTEASYTLPNEVVLSKLTESADNNTHFTSQSATIAISTAYYASVFVKKGSASRNIGIQVTTSGGTGVTYGVSINPDTGVLTAGVGVTAFTSVTATLVKGEADAWLILASFPAGNNTSAAVAIAPYSSVSNISYAGDGASYVYAGGVQLTSKAGQSYLLTNNLSTTGLAVRNTRPALVTFPSVSSNKWRLQIDNNNVACYFADIRFGDLMTTEYGLYMGFTPPELARETEFIDNKSDRGLPLGRSVKARGASTKCNFEFMSDAYMRATWLPFVRHAELKPFYMAWNYTDYPHEVAFLQTDGAIDKPTHTQYGRMGVTLSVAGFIE